TALGDVTVSGGGPADGRALRVGGAGGAAPRAELGHVADTGRGAALGCARLEGVGRAVVRGAVAALGDVTVPRGNAADGRALRVRGAAGAAPRAGLGQVADAGRGATLGRARLEAIGRAIGAQAGAELGDVAGTPRSAALGRARLEEIGRAVVGDPVTGLGDVTVPRGRAADGRALRIRGAAGAAPRAELGHVADAGRGSALGRARLEGVGRAVVRDAVAALGDVTVSCGAPADGRALRVGGAAGAAPRAELGHVADTGRSAALGRARLEEIGRAVVGDPVTGLGDVTVPRGKAADRRALRIRGAVGAAPGAEFGRVADAGGGAALDRARLEGVGGAIGAPAGAELGDVAGTPRSAALGRARLEAIGRAVVGDPVAALGEVTVPRCKAADGRALRIRGAVSAAPRAE